MASKSIRCGRGLGDSIYLQSVARHIASKGTALRVRSDFPDVFRNIAVEVEPFSKVDCDIVAHYVTRKRMQGTTQFEDCCIAAGILEPVEMHLDWRAIDTRLMNQLRSLCRPYVCIQLPRYPMGRVDGFGIDLLPERAAYQRAVDSVRDQFTVVQIGAGDALYQLDGIDLDLSNNTSVSELLDVASEASGFVGYCSFMVPLAESFDKPALFVWSRRGLKSQQPFVRSVTPAKILHKKTSGFVIDDASSDEIRSATGLFLRCTDRNRGDQG